MAVGWLALTLSTAIASRAAWAHVFPDAVVVVVAFVALRRDPVPAVAVAVGLGYLAGRQALAPLGLYETTLVATALAVYVVSGQLAGAGALFFSVIAAGASGFATLLQFVLLWLARDAAGFSSLATALLIPDALLTGLVALAAHHPMDWMDRKLFAERHEGLQWQ